MAAPDTPLPRPAPLVRSADDPARIVWITDDGGAGLRHGREPLAGWWPRFITDVLAVLVPEHLL